MQNKRNILIFSTAYLPLVGGAEIAVKEITDRLGSDFEFDLITAKLQKDLPKFEKIGNVNVYRVGSGGSVFDKIFLPFSGAIFASKLNKDRKYFCMWGIMATFSTGAGYILNIYRQIVSNNKIPMVLTLQEGDSDTYLKYKWGGLIALSWKLALRRTDYLTAISNFLLNRAQKNGYAGESFLVPNGVDISLFSKEIPEDTKIELKKKLDKKEGEVFLVTSGRLTHKNATDDIISALTHLPENISLIVIGKGEDGVRLQKQANDINVSKRVKFIGFIDYNDLPRYLSICDIFIRPSRSEGFGNSFIEAMAAKIPVIATPVGGIPDFIDDNETGIFCSTDNPQSIVKAVNILLENSSLREGIVRKAHDRVIERYSWERVSKEMKAVFDRVS